MEISIRLATPGDIDGLVALDSRYYIGNLKPEEAKNGFLSMLHPRDWFAKAVGLGGIHVAVDESGEVGGYMAVTPRPDPEDPRLPAVVREMVRLADSNLADGKFLATRPYAIHGPVCIDERFRGKGVFSAFHQATRNAYRNLYDRAVLFVSVDNPRSLHTATAKLGARTMGRFFAEGAEFHLLVMEF